MVLFKRKPVQFLQPPQIDDESSEVWHIPQTGEVFETYDEYLNRIDFYNQPRFICQITGHSGLTFFDALKSELAGAEEVEQAFPEALKGPILRRVQFQTTSRIDTLVDMIYDEFKSDYYPGEAVTIQLASGERLTGIVRDKARLGSKVLPDGTLTQPYSRYSTSIDGRPDEEAVVDSEHLYRDRKIFTKSILRSFIKKTVTREAWNGAPWLVKHDVAAQYHIDTRVPLYLRYDNKLLERKQQQAQKRALQPINGSHEMNGMNGGLNSFGPARLPELKPAPKAHKVHRGPASDHPPHPGSRARAVPNYFLQQDHGPVPSAPGDNPYHFPVPFRQSAPPAPATFTKPEPPPPPPPPPKYPIEDLQLEPRDDYVRPALQFLCRDTPEGIIDSGILNEKIQMKSVGPLLETWDTLNVYCEIFKLDSFTFDDFLQALEITSMETPCQLFTEIHCAVLKQIVSAERDGGKLQVNLPELDEEEDEEGEEESAEPTPEPGPEPKPTTRATRSSLAKLEAERMRAEAEAAEKEKTPEVTVIHRAPELLAHFQWIDELKGRNFQDGGWEMIMVGLLYQLSKDSRQTAACEKLLAQLVPSDAEPIRDVVREQYSALDLNLRISALQIICMLTMETKAIRGYMDDCAETMTGYRKEKIEWQRNRKQGLEELKVLLEERKIQLPENMPPSPPADGDEGARINGDVKMTGTEEPADEPSEDADDSEDEPNARRTLRRGGDRAAERQRKREEQERKKEAELAAKVPKQSKQFIKLLKGIQKKEEYIKKCESEIAVLDNDLREADCGRTRVLGKDRFWNRYYWFERNGMPYAGLPNSSTAEAGYANGCIWVQGPDDIEREGYVDLAPQFQAEYKAKFKMTVPQRKKMEEGRTSVFNARQWGYYSEVEQLDSLLNWLDPRGFNELRLRKEILLYKDKIVENMENRMRYLSTEDAESSEKEPDKKADAKRMSTRAKAQPSAEPTHYRCCNWTNSMAIDEIGHLHSEPPPPPPKSRKGGRKSRN
ncbi:ATP-utilizing chromatin assembly and remodelling N-terminal-domain-containing protein [Xylariaceae sp. FL0255]|nr:ATP-utilizing chromatin assembly and remodelling N-terminal-domain-containing protein [Xylariaceae sp. FL0255]